MAPEIGLKGQRTRSTSLLFLSEVTGNGKLIRIISYLLINLKGRTSFFHKFLTKTSGINLSGLTQSTSHSLITVAKGWGFTDN